MVDESHLKREGVAKIVKTPAGRKYLERLKKQRPNDFLQPSDPKFRKVYGEPT